MGVTPCTFSSAETASGVYPQGRLEFRFFQGSSRKTNVSHEAEPRGGDAGNGFGCDVRFVRGAA